MKIELFFHSLHKASYLILLTAAFTFINVQHVRSQQIVNDYNTYYQYPFSVGVEYAGYTPFAEYGASFNVFEIAGVFRYPLPSLPFLQPMVKVGMIAFDSQDLDEPLLWDNRHFFAGIGLTVPHRFAKTFEIGGEAAVSISQSYFEHLLPEQGTVGQMNLLLELGARVDLDPSYNFNISIHPGLKYLLGFGLMDELNSVIFSIGFGVNYRFGTDPDSPASDIRSIQFSDVNIPSAFAAMQSYYVKNPLGSVRLTNTEQRDITDVSISFYQEEFMDTPTQSAVIPAIPAGGSIEADILASFNREVFSTEGITPLTGEIIVTYFSGGRPAEQRQPVSFDLYDKTSVTWDDDRKAAAFITPADSALRNYSSFIRQSCRDVTMTHYNSNLQFAIQAFHALGEVGMLYQIDPTRPFTEVSGDPMVVDSISLPRDTLRRITGDCDDLTVLYSSLLETVGIKTGFITVPGHIYAVFNTGESSSRYRNIHTDRAMTINLDGELWVPVEITMIGSAGFTDAWQKGAQQWNAWDDEPEKRGFYTTESAQNIYRPVGLRETDLGLQYGSAGNISSAFERETQALAQRIVEYYRIEAENNGNRRCWNNYGIACARFSRYREAVKAFNRVIALDRGNIAAIINLGNIKFLQNDYTGARGQYLKASKQLENSGKEGSNIMLKTLINISTACYELEEFDEAALYLGRAENIDPAAAAEYSYLAGVTSDSGADRAAGTVDPASNIIFMEETE